jgi:hypothetical protein
MSTPPYASHPASAARSTSDRSDSVALWAVVSLLLGILVAVVGFFAVAKPGELVRFWVVDAGPSLDTDFHIVGTVLNAAYPFGDMRPADALHDVQTVTVPAGGGGVFDVEIDKPGLYPFVSHAFAAVDQGQVGLLNVGGVHGTMSH